jgi:hypothetical protein
MDYRGWALSGKQTLHKRQFTPNSKKMSSYLVIDNPRDWCRRDFLSSKIGMKLGC